MSKTVVANYQGSSLNSNQMKDLIAHYVHTNKQLQSQGKPPVAFSIVGAAGISKTSIVEQKAKELGLHFVKLDLGQFEELGDLVGMPVKEFELHKMELVEGKPAKVKGSEKWVIEGTLPVYLNVGYVQSGRCRTSIAKPAWVEGLPENGILLIDDATRAASQFLTATMELIRVQTYASWSLPKGWTVILTENPDDGSYNVNSIDEAQRTRFVQFKMKFDMDAWATWAESVRMDTRCISFMMLHRDLVKTAMDNPEQRVNARSITNFFNSISSIANFETKESLALINMIGEGSIGPILANQFVMNFINKGGDKMITPHQVLTEDSKKVFDRLEFLIKPGTNDERADIASMMIFRLNNYLISMCENGETIGKAINQRIIEIMESEVFGMDLKLRIGKGVLVHPKHGDKFAEARSHKSLMRIIA
jgi:hypothetical protein